jgi:hypothetical protein
MICCHCYITYLHPLALNEMIGDPVLCIASDGFGLLHFALCFVAVPLHNASHTIMWSAHDSPMRLSDRKADGWVNKRMARVCLLDVTGRSV